MSTNLKEHTRQLLIASDLPDREVACLLHCSMTWVRMFKDQQIKSPNVDLIQKLYEHLTGKPLLDV